MKYEHLSRWLDFCSTEIYSRIKKKDINELREKIRKEMRFYVDSEISLQNNEKIKELESQIQNKESIIKMLENQIQTGINISEKMGYGTKKYNID